jgi:hypothetical protein
MEGGFFGTLRFFHKWEDITARSVTYGKAWLGGMRGVGQARDVCRKGGVRSVGDTRDVWRSAAWRLRRE